MEKDKEIEFVAARYREGRFRIAPAWAKIIGKNRPRRQFQRIAAAVAVVLALAATAAVIVRNYTLTQQEVVEAPASAPVAPMEVSRVIDFEDSPLPEVIGKITEVYGVEVVNMPENAGQYRLSLHYEGNVTDLIGTINELFDTNLKIKEV